jgi:hypothetical protein
LEPPDLKHEPFLYAACQETTSDRMSTSYRGRSILELLALSGAAAAR